MINADSVENGVLPKDCKIHEVTAQFLDGQTYTEFAYYDCSKDEWYKYDDDSTVRVVAWRKHATPYVAK